MVTLRSLSSSYLGRFSYIPRNISPVKHTYSYKENLVETTPSYGVESIVETEDRRFLGVIANERTAVYTI